jgi:hypothetical protein
MRRVATQIPRPAAILILVAASSILLAASPPPSGGPGPAMPEPPPSQLPVPMGPLFPVPPTDPLDRPSGQGAGLAAPVDVQGAWYSGTVSSVGYVDPDLGSYSDGGSEGLMYAFLPDGGWQSGWLLASQLYGCAMRVMVFRSGVIADSQPSEGLLQLDTRTAQIHSEDTCSVEGTYERDLPPDDETLFWWRTTDDYGEVLMLRGPDTAWSLFRPMRTS